MKEILEYLPTILGSLVAGVVAIWGAYVAGLKTKNKHKKDTYSTLMDSIEKLTTRQAKLEEEIESLRRQVDELRNYQSKFEIALGYIRDLCHWVGTLPGIDAKQKPHMPAIIKQHYGEYEIER